MGEAHLKCIMQLQQTFVILASACVVQAVALTRAGSLHHIDRTSSQLSRAAELEEEAILDDEAHLAGMSAGLEQLEQFIPHGGMHHKNGSIMNTVLEEEHYVQTVGFEMETKTLLVTK